MTTDNYTMRVLRAEEGKYLTNADAGRLADRIIATEVYLAVTDDPSRWVEITAEEADRIKAEQEAEVAKQRDSANV